MRKKLDAALLLAILLVWAAATAGVAGADPLPSCHDLALQYATAPAQMDADALAALGTCVMNAIQERSGASSEPAPSAQPQATAEETPVDSPGWGQWPASAPWSDSGAKTKSWGNE